MSSQASTPKDAMTAVTSSPPLGPTHHQLEIVFIPAPKPISSSLGPKSPHLYYVTLSLICRDLPGVMRDGILWTEHNILSEQSSIGEKSQGLHYRFYRSWGLRECPDKPVDQSRWQGRITISAHTIPGLVGFRLDSLRRDQIFSARATNALGKCVFQFRCESRQDSFNHIYNHDASDLWWLWPMGSVGLHQGVVSRTSHIENENMEKRCATCGYRRGEGKWAWLASVDESQLDMALVAFCVAAFVMLPIMLSLLELVTKRC